MNPKQGYDVGIVEGEDGVIALECDMTYSPGKLVETLGKNFTELKKKYVVAVTDYHYDKVTIEETFADGSFIILAEDNYQ